MKLNVARGTAQAPQAFEVDAYLIEIPEALPFQFAAYRAADWEIVEASTGRAVAHGETRKKALATVVRKLRDLGVPKLYAAVAGAPTLNEQFAVTAIEPTPSGAYCELPLGGTDEETQSG